MAKIHLFLVLALGFLILSVPLVYTLAIPDVPDPTCAGGWNIHGEYYPREQGGCCTGTECCQYEAFKDSPACVPPSCSGLDCCQYDEYKNTPLCVVSPPPSEDNCSGTECCQYDEYADTPLCVIQPTEEECAQNPPDCPTGGVFNDAPALRDTFIPGGGLCRGACGPDCPDTCVNVGTVTKCVTDSKGCAYTCTYENTVSCGVHDACVVHDSCYDVCAAKGETSLCIDAPGPWWNPLTWLGMTFGPCHCACDYGCASNYGFDCLNWMDGNGPFDYRQQYSDKPIQEGPFKSCPG